MSKLPEYEIYAIRYAKQDERSEAHMFLGGDHHKIIQGLDFFTYALNGGGRTWIVDTGMTAFQAKRMGRQYDFILRPSQALAKIGIDAACEPDVILTHAHFDHVGTVADYAKARFHIQDAEMLHVTGRDMTHAPFRAAYHAEDIKALVDLVFQDRMVFHKRRRNPGARHRVSAPWRPCARPGYRAGQYGARLGRSWLPTRCMSFEEVDQERPFAIFYDLPGMLEGYRRINRLAGARDLIIPGHDHRVTKAYPAAPGMDGKVVRLDKPPAW